MFNNDDEQDIQAVTGEFGSTPQYTLDAGEAEEPGEEEMFTLPRRRSSIKTGDQAGETVKSACGADPSDCAHGPCRH